MTGSVQFFEGEERNYVKIIYKKRKDLYLCYKFLTYWNTITRIRYKFLKHFFCMEMPFCMAILTYKFKCDFTMCADSANARDTSIGWNTFAWQLEKYDANGYERRRDVTTSHETHRRQMWKVSSRWSNKARVLQSELSRVVSKSNWLRSSFGR